MSAPVQIAVITLFICCLGAILSGYSLLKVYDEFKKAIKTNSRARFFLASSMAMLILIVTILTFTVFGTALQQKLSNNNHKHQVTQL